MNPSKRMVIVPAGLHPEDPSIACWQVMFEGFEESSPLPRGWRGTIDDMLEQVRYVAVNHDVKKGLAVPEDEDWQARVARYQEFWNRYCDHDELRAERDKLRREVVALRCRIDELISDDRVPFDDIPFAHYRATNSIATTDVAAMASKVREHYEVDIPTR